MNAILKGLILASFFFISACTTPTEHSTSTTPGAGDKLITGPVVDVTTQVIPPSGGTITVDKPGDPLNGFQLMIPPNAFTQSQNINISYAEVKSHSLGSYVTPVSPLITITSGGGYSAQEIKIKVPVKLAPGYFAMGFLFDETTGKLEPLPVQHLDSTSIIITTRQLSLPNASLGKGLFKTSQSVYGNLIISSVLESALRGKNVISTGFKPGIDDWEFPNYGSYISPRGHCAGQSVTAMWYFYEQKLKGAPGLFKRFDKISDPNKPDSLWCDNPLGYRFASTIQEYLNFDTWVRDLEYESWVPNIVFNMFVYSMLLYAEPQLVLIRNSKDGSGHAMVVYAIGTDDGMLYIADPNYPNNRKQDGSWIDRVIQYIPGGLTGQFLPYASPRKVGEAWRTFDQIGYAAKTSHIEWSKISERWAEFQNGTIGGNRFPIYDLYENHTGVKFTDGFITALDTITVISESPGCAFGFLHTYWRQEIFGYDVLGKRLARTKNSGELSLALKPGDNTFGLYLMGTAADTLDHYLDFKWMKVHRNINLTIASTEANRAPLSTPGMKNKLYTFVAKADRPVPTDGKVKYEWSFDDGLPPTSINNDSTVTHTFTQDGTFTVKVGFYYDLVKTDTTTAQASIVPTPPMISSINPNVAKVGDTVKVVGKNFGIDKTKGTVKFTSGIVATDITSWIDTTISVKVPPGAQSGAVTVTVNNLTSNAVTFTVTTLPVPVITSLTPSTAMVTDTISIDGNNFGTDKTKGTVSFTGILITGNGTVSWTNTRIRVVVPGVAVTGPLAVSVNGVVSNQALLTISGSPSITSVSSTQVSYAMPVRISGKNFGAAQGTSSIRFGTYAAKSVVSWHDNEIVATVPEPFTSGVITLTINGKSYGSGAISLSNNHQITSVSPDSAFAREVITIRGKMFGYEQGRSTIIFGYVDTATVVSWSDTVLTVIVPEPGGWHYGTKRIEVTLGNGNDKVYNNFFVIEDVLETLHRSQALGNILFGGALTMYSNPPGTNDTKYGSSPDRVGKKDGF